MRTFKFIALFLLLITHSIAQDGYKLWLQYYPIEKSEFLQQPQKKHISVSLPESNSPTIEAIKTELSIGLSQMLNLEIDFQHTENADLQFSISDGTSEEPDGFQILDENTSEGEMSMKIKGDSEVGLLYGTFRFLQWVQMSKPLDNVDFSDSPKIDIRILNHWDNLDRTVERGYAGFSIFDWHTLPEYVPQYYTDYARANASVGINATVVTNVNANALILREDYLDKVAALADVFRPYGIKIYLTARFSAPIELGGLETADPLDSKVRLWWQAKIEEIYHRIPDFGGFLVKANSEGQPGPQDYQRNHADGANMLADALNPYGGIVMWRAFVYSEHEPDDRAKQAYDEFMALDGQFRENVLIQVKNGPIDFQPREPIHPLFGALRQTPVMMEFQITKEYLGQGTHLVYLPEMYEEVLQTDTYHFGVGTTVSNILQGNYNAQKLTSIAGVANIGTARNWTGHLFGQADWYGFGRLAWNPDLASEQIAEEWIDLTFQTNSETKLVIKDIMGKSYEALVKYMSPLGLHHIMATGHHYGPGPWVSDLSRPEWNPTYYHRADKEGVGFDRTESGSNAIGQYHPALAKNYLQDERFLLWFQRVEWSQKLSNGKTLWWNLVNDYNHGVKVVEDMVAQWEEIEENLDDQRAKEVGMLLKIQLKEAKWWRDACLAYFQSHSGLEFPDEFPAPEQELQYYEKLNYPYAPGIRPRW